MHLYTQTIHLAMKKLLLATFLLVAITGISQEIQEKYQRAKISLSKTQSIDKLANLDISVEHGMRKQGYYIISEFSVSELERARANGFQVEVLIEDAKAHFLQQNRNNTPPEQRNPTCATGGSETYDTPTNFNLGSMGGYLTYQELLDELDDMRAQYPNLISAPSNISGPSGDFLTQGQPNNGTTPPIGGNGIKWVRISDNPDVDENEPEILYDAIHHAREPMSLSQLVFYMWYLLENYDTDPEIASIVDNTELYFIPVLNPDGYLFNQLTDPNGGGFWRKNRRNGNGVDNNRNYDYHINGNPNNGSWSGPGASGNPNSETYYGTAPFSEVENQAMKWFVENHNFVMAFNNHSFGQLLYFPFSYANVATPDEALFQTIGGELTSRNGYNPLRDFPFSGDSDDFMYGTVGTHNKIFSFTPEIGNEFWPPSNQIVPIAQDMMYLNLTAARMTNNYAAITDTAPQFTGNDATADASFDIRRLGITGSGTFTVSLNPISNNITAVGNPVTFNNMVLLDTESGTIQYTIGAAQDGDAISYEIVVNNGSFDRKLLVSKTFGQLTSVFEDPGDSVTQNFVNNGWGTTTSTFVSPSSSITDSPGGNYPDNTNETIRLTNVIDLTEATAANATFFARWEIENNFDYVQFEVSTNNGGSWIPQCGKFTNEGGSNQPQGQPLYDGVQNAWVQEEVDLSDYLGESILIRFQLVSDGGVTGDGFYFDDLKINTVEEGTLSVNEALATAFSVYPNPVQENLNITTPLTNYNLEIFNLQGQRLYFSQENSGSKTVDYSSFANGIYVMKFTSEGASHTVKIIKQ